jgi:hypothetical protein
MKKRYHLDEAIKTFYKTDALKVDLAASVANKVFAEHKKAYAFLDRGLYLLVSVLVIGGVFYCFSLFKQLPAVLILLITVGIVSYFLLSYKEYTVMSKRLLSAV